VLRKLILVVAVFVMPLTSLQAGVRIGIGIGLPLYPPWGYYGYYRPYGPYYPYYYPPPVVVQPAPPLQPAVGVAQQPPDAYPPSLQAPPSPAARGSAPIITDAPAIQTAGIDEHLQALSSPDVSARQNAAMSLGRMGADRAVDALTATLAGDANPAVRDAAARALGLIAAQRSLPALIRAAQADNDRDVRHSAQFAVEIIRTNARNR